MSYDMDVNTLIEEVKKRPTLWDMRSPEYLDRNNTPHLWQEIADILKVDVESCKRKWKNLRDAYRAEIRRAERRAEMRKANGQPEPKQKVISKWIYFQPLSFVNETKRVRHQRLNLVWEGNNSSQDQHSFETETRRQRPNAVSEGNSSSQEQTNFEAESRRQRPNAVSEGNSLPAEQPSFEPEMHSFCNVKMEPLHTTDEDEDENDESDMLLEEFQSITTPQAVRRLSHTISMANAAADESVGETNAQPVDEKNCKCSKRSDEQVHFLEDLEREERKLMQSTHQDMTRLDTVSHVGDADYNFLVSFLPQMKKMSELQNLQFRAKMSELLLHIMAPGAVSMVGSSTSSGNIRRHSAANTMQQHQHQHQQMMSHYLTTADDDSADADTNEIDNDFGTVDNTITLLNDSNAAAPETITGNWN